MQGRQGMLSQTAIAQKCEEAKEGHDRPFVVEWDATDLSSFEAAARQRTLFVKYEGCSLRVLYECRDPNVITRFGSYGQPEFTSGGEQGFDIENQGELYAKLPLGAASLSGRLAEDESLHLKYFVTGVTTSSRESMYRNEIKSTGGCEGATHFVWGFNLGAFELDSKNKTEGEAKAGFQNLGAGASGSRKQAQVARGGDIASCSTQDQRGCRMPIRLSLRPIREGDNPLDKAGPVAATPGQPQPGLPAAVQEQIDTSNSAQEALAEASRQFNDAHDGGACIKLLDRALALDPRQAERTRFLYPRCMMRAGKCDEGTKRERERLAAEDTKRIKSDATLDAEARKQANFLCPSSTAKNETDFVLRASRELSEAAHAKNRMECKAGFDKLYPRVKAGDEEWRAERKANPNTAGVGQAPWNMSAQGALPAAAKCIAEGGTCAEGLAYHKRAYCMQLRDMKGCEKIATENWDTQIKLGHVVCK